MLLFAKLAYLFWVYFFKIMNLIRNRLDQFKDKWISRKENFIISVKVIISLKHK